MSIPVKSPKKLIEVALPLDAINRACAYEKMPGIGAHPRGIHLWWARRPLAGARAVIFAQMVNDPGGERGYFPGMTRAQAATKRDELLKIVEELVLWENLNNEPLLQRARKAIVESWVETCRLNKSHPQAGELFNPDTLPAFHDPFAGGGALPLEAQRLGLEAHASDLNPVAVTINKAMIDIPAKFRGCSPVGPTSDHGKQEALHEDWAHTRGLAQDVKRYGAWMQSQAMARIGHLYPSVLVTEAMAAERPDLTPYLGRELAVCAWLWARTVHSPNPAFSHATVPLVSTFVLSNKQGNAAFVQPIVKGDEYRFTVGVGALPKDAVNGTKASGVGANFLCLLSGTPIDATHIRAEGRAGKLGTRLMAIVADGPRGRIYLPPIEEHSSIAASATPAWRPDVPFMPQALGFRVGNYGHTTWADLFTPRQLVAMDTLSGLVTEVVEKCRSDAKAAGLADDGLALDVGGRGALAYAQAVGTYLAFAVDRCADFGNSGTRWVPGNQKTMNLFGRQAVSMTWDFPETAVLNGGVGGFMPAVDYIAGCLATLPISGIPGLAVQEDAATGKTASRRIVSTDPPYYDNIGYADLSDFFYVWLRRSLREIYPGLFATVAVPKAEELVATPYRHGGKEEAEAFFLDGMTRALSNLALQAHPAFPITVYYAFKQAETKGSEGTASTGWVTFLEAVLRAGFAITGTWPVRTEQTGRMRDAQSNALASSIVLVCRRRHADAPTVSRREFVRELNASLPDALLDMTRGGLNSPVAPVDLSQAVIGPGMAIFSQHAAVLEADGQPMSVRSALQLINRFLSEDDFDADTQFCIHWFETMGWATGRYGEADVLARAKGTSVGGLVESGVLESGGGETRLLRWGEYPPGWSPEDDRRLAVWEMLHQLIRLLNLQGEASAGGLLARMPDKAESVRALAYRLYTLCERKGWAEDARAYNELITSWTGIEMAANEAGPRGTQTRLDI